MVVGPEFFTYAGPVDADPAPQLIRGEPWGASRQDDSARWLSVYDQLIALHEHMLRQAERAPAGPAGSRRAPLERWLAQLASRREYWHECCLNLARIVYDGPATSRV
jgi:hypothetical protein